MQEEQEFVQTHNCIHLQHLFSSALTMEHLKKALTRAKDHSLKEIADKHFSCLITVYMSLAYLPE